MSQCPGGRITWLELGAVLVRLMQRAELLLYRVAHQLMPGGHRVQMNLLRVGSSCFLGIVANYAVDLMADCRIIVFVLKLG